MKKVPNRIPSPKILAKHFSQGKFCNFPADYIYEAVNSHDYPYNSVAVPPRLGFLQFFMANAQAFVHLMAHNSPEELRRFRQNPEWCLREAGIEPVGEFDEAHAEIFASMVEPEILPHLRVFDAQAYVDNLLRGLPESWCSRHTRRYPEGLLMLPPLEGLRDIPTYFPIGLRESMGIGSAMVEEIMKMILEHFIAKE